MKQLKSQTDRKNNKNFQAQLQEQLNMIPKKDQFSNQKVKTHKIFNKESFMLFQQKQLNLNQNASIFEMSSLTDKQNSLSPNSIIKQKEKNSTKKQQKKQYNSSIFEIISEKEVEQHLYKYFQSRKQIQISQFVEMVLLEYFSQQKFGKDQIKQFVSTVSSDLSTTNQNILSLNALQILLKKTSIKEYFLQMMLKIKYKRKKKQLQKDYNQIFNQMIEQKKQIQNKEMFLAKLQDQLNRKIEENMKKQKNIIQKQKELLNKEKELTAKQKQFKKYLQERHQKLMQSQLNLLEKTSKQIDKKMVNFQRVAKNKQELLQKRTVQYKNLLKTKVQINSSATQKRDQQLISLKLKLKKIQKQFQVLKFNSTEQLKNVQKQSNNLLKANTIFQSKIEKQKQKIKLLNDEIQKKNQEILSLKIQVQNKNQQILQFQRAIVDQTIKQKLIDSQFNQKQKQNSSQSYSNSKHYKNKNQLKSSRKKKIQNSNQKSKRNKNQMNLDLNRQQNYYEDQQNNFQNQIQIIFSSFNDLFEIMLQRFDLNKQKKEQQEQSDRICSKQNSLEELLVNDAQNILNAGIKIIHRCMKFKVVNINFIVKFLFKIYLAKCSFLRFQQINQILVKDQKYIQSFIQKVRNLGNKNIQYLFFSQNAYQFLNKYKTFREEKNIKIDQNLELVLLLIMIGCNEIYDKTSKQSVSMLSIVKYYVYQQIQKVQKLESKNSLQKLSDLQECELITFLFANFLQNYQTCEEFLQILLSICNLESNSFLYQKNKRFLLFQSISQLQNYKYLLKCMLGFQSHEQIMQKSSIILQRFFYNYSENIQIDEEDIRQIKKLKEKLEIKKPQSLILANLTSIIQSLT